VASGQTGPSPTSTIGLALDYHSFVITYSMLLGSHTFDDLHSKLIFYK